MAVADSPQIVAIAPAERAGYSRSGDAQVYYRLHPPPEEVTGAALLCGPWGSERDYAHGTWTRWARALSERGFLAMRFDYRGMAESSGDGGAVSLADYVADAAACLGVLRSRALGIPLVLHGLRFGAVIVKQLFARGDGDALLLWDPPATQVSAQGDVLRYRVAEDAVREDGVEPRVGSVAELMVMLDAGSEVTSEGHCIPPRLWRDLKSLVVKCDAGDGRRVRAIRLDAGPKRRSPCSVSIPSPPFWRPGRRLVPDLAELFESSLNWVTETVAEVRR